MACWRWCRGHYRTDSLWGHESVGVRGPHVDSRYGFAANNNSGVRFIRRWMLITPGTINPVHARVLGTNYSDDIHRGLYIHSNLYSAKNRENESEALFCYTWDAETIIFWLRQSNMSVWAITFERNMASDQIFVMRCCFICLQFMYNFTVTGGIRWKNGYTRYGARRRYDRLKSTAHVHGSVSTFTPVLTGGVDGTTVNTGSVISVSTDSYYTGDWPANKWEPEMPNHLLR